MTERQNRNIEQVVIFDGECAVCNRFARISVQWLAAENTAFVASQSELGGKVLAHLGLPADPSTVYLVHRGTILERSEAVFRLCGNFRRPYRWLSALRFIPRPIRDWGYDRLANWRRYWGPGHPKVCVFPRNRSHLLLDSGEDWGHIRPAVGNSPVSRHSQDHD